MPSPFRPSVNHVDSVENFDKIWTDQAAEDSPCGTPPAPDGFPAAHAAFEVRLTTLDVILSITFYALCWSGCDRARAPGCLTPAAAACRTLLEWEGGRPQSLVARTRLSG
jgi:hypothetical protein